MTTLFPYRPETPLLETLRFLTDILPHKDGSEQRVACRIAPRQEFTHSIMAEDGLERQLLENMLFDIQDEDFYLPIWPDITQTTAAAGIGATSVSCDTTLSDFRSGGKAIIYLDTNVYQVLDGITVAAGTITFSNALMDLWPAGSEVFPLRTAMLTDQLKCQRWANNLTRYSLPWVVKDNDTYLGGGSLPFTTLGFGADSAKLVIDDANSIIDTLSETMDRRIIVVDGDTGLLSSYTNWDRSRRGSMKTWVSTSRQKIWQIRKVLHYLKGQQTSFLLPSFAHDLTAKTDISSGSTTLNVVKSGLSTYTALSRLPRKYIRVLKVDGTKVDASVTGATSVDATTEQITISAPWGVNVTQANIDRMMILEKVRIDADEIQIQHQNLVGQARVSFAVKSVIE